MNKKRYTAPSKLAAWMLMVAFLICSCVFGACTIAAALVGCYNQGLLSDTDAYQSGFCWNEARYYSYWADDWYNLSESNKLVTLSYSEQQRYEQLTEFLTRSSLIAERIDENNNGIVKQAILKPIPENAIKYAYFDEDDTGNTAGYQIYIDPTSRFGDIFTQSALLYDRWQAEGWQFPVFLVVFGAAALVVWIFLLFTAGHSPDGTITLKGFHTIPFDVLTLMIAVVSGLLLSACVGLQSTIHMTYGLNWGWIFKILAAWAAGIGAVVFLIMVWVHTMAARIKAKAFWCSTIIGRLCLKISHGLRHGVGQVIEAGRNAKQQHDKKEDEGKQPFLDGVQEKLKGINWRYNKITALFSTIGRGIYAAIRQMIELFLHIGVIWKLCAITAAILIITQCIAACNDDSAFSLVLMMDVMIVLAVAFFARQLDRLKQGGARLASGDLSYKIPTDHMYWDLQQHAQDLNAISDGMAVAVEERLKSERMKYELLTNVSHDIKTPLTSIINYVELLKSEPAGSEQAKGYIEVLDRQAAKLKKLITDLIEVSKATTGNITVQAERTHAGELLRQCVGEYSERFEEKELETVLTMPAQEPSIYADGRLLWRIFDNLLGNIYKYAMPKTRVYIDLATKENRVFVSLKNISRERLNLASDELMERFVRGDAARTTEGSGLGLSIARSLAELMQGKFELTVDGDLFKIVLIFPQMPDSAAEK